MSSRSRTTRACDKCSSSRARCDGKFPCRRCQDYSLPCGYTREVKRRGRRPGSTRSALSLRNRKKGQPSSAREPHPKLNTVTQLRSPVAISPSPPSLSPPSAGIPSTGAQLEPACEQHSSTGLLPVTSISSILSSQPSLENDVYAERWPNSSFTTAGALGTQSKEPGSHTHGNAASPALEHVAGPADAWASGSSQDRRTSACDNLSDIHYAPSVAVRAGTTAGVAPLTSLSALAPNECRYTFLNPVLPFLHGIMSNEVACELLDIYLTDPDSSLFRSSSPYILTRIFRKSSIIDSANPRPTTPALLATILWTVAQTADIITLRIPGSRTRITNQLYKLAATLMSKRDPDKWRRVHGGLSIEQDTMYIETSEPIPATTATNEPGGLVDDVLTFILFAITVSAGDFKSDTHKWWSKATRMAFALRLHEEDGHCQSSHAPCPNVLCSSCNTRENSSMARYETKEERRRVFWLLFSLDRHLALSFNRGLSIPDCSCQVYAPLPEFIWENLDQLPWEDLPPRTMTPPTTISGTSYFEYFLPLMVILGDIIEIHRRKQHPRLGKFDATHSIVAIKDLLSEYEASLQKLSAEPRSQDAPLCSPVVHNYWAPAHMGPNVEQQPGALPIRCANEDESRRRLVAAYSTHILHVLHVLLYGKWDAISMLDDEDGWITSLSFNECAAHAITASQSVSAILTIDPELTFMPYLFGIYLLQGSFILLLFADRMPQLGPNKSVEEACETIIRAHEVCVVTLNTEFQRSFRKVLRSTLFSVRNARTADWMEHNNRRAALSLYRWTRGAKGLAL